MAGMQHNPGPAGKYVFRYQYLLVSLGTDVLRKVFDVVVGNNIVQYLTAKSQDIQNLKALTADQRQLLPPINNKPDSSKFDITLLSCLLRNICGLHQPKDNVWINPAPTDYSVEADITRLRMCRNQLMHSDKLVLPVAELKSKWQDLSVILLRLNNVSGIAQLQSDINNAKIMEIDEQLRDKLDKTLQEWHESDKLLGQRIDDVVSEVGNVKQDLVGVESEVSNVKQDLVGVVSEVGNVKQDLVGVGSEVGNVKQDLVGVVSEVGNVKQDLVGVKKRLEDVEVLGQRIDEVVSEVGNVKQDVVGVVSEVGNVKRDLFGVGIEVGNGNVKQDLVGVKKKLEDVEVLGQRIDDVVSEVGNVKQDLVGVVSEVTNVRQDVELLQQEIKCQHKLDHRDIQKYLVDFYRRRCSTLPVSPLFKNKDENILSIYKYPTMCSVKCNGQENTEKKEMKSYEDVFCKDGRVFEEIYIVGDAGVGKTSFCRCMSLLWCYAKSDDQLEDKNKVLQKDVDYMSKFEFVFYVSLRDSCHTRVEDMIIEQLFRGDKAKYQISIDTILRDKQTLILMDGLDEWVPTQVAGKQTYELPDRIYSKNCVYVTTTRPYRIESVRLSRNDVDHQVEIKGIFGESAMSYIEDVIQYMNKENKENRKLTYFFRDIKKCNLRDELCIPIIASHLVILWFEQTLTNMPRALIYAYILEMLFKRAEKRGVDIPSPTESKFQDLPKSLSGLKYLNKHGFSLYNVCHLSFRSLFKQDENASKLVFTVDQLQDEPYCFTDAETDFLCKIGILSKNEVFGCYSEEKLKISFIHKSYIEFFAALFISSSDISQLFDTKWKLSFVIQSEHLIMLLVGLFAEGGKVLFNNYYQSMSDDLSLCRRNAIFHYDSFSDQRQIQSLQNVVINCFKEVSRSNDTNIALKLEDFIFDGNANVDILRQLLLLNTTCVKSIHSVDGKYYDEFDQITNLQYFHVAAVLSGDYIKFTECMLQNQSTLHTIGIEGAEILIPVLPVRSLQHLTSLSLFSVTMRHNGLHNLVAFLSENVHIENIKLTLVYCDNHQVDDSTCTFTLNLPDHTKLISLYLQSVNIVCNNVNKSSLKSITLNPLSESIVRYYIDVFKCIKYSQLEHLDIYVSTMLDNNTIKTLADTVNTLPCIKSLRLWEMKLPDDVLLQLHPDVTQVDIDLYNVTMSCQCFHCFIESCVNNKSVIKVELGSCCITSVDGETHRVLSRELSVHYMSKYLTSIPTVNITYEHVTGLNFETRSCQ